MYRRYQLKNKDVIYAEKKGIKELKKRRSHKARLKRRNRNGFKTPYFNNQLKEEQFYDTVYAPKNFSILTNADNVIAYFNEIKMRTDENVGVGTRMDMSKINQTDLPTLCLLTSYMLDKKTNAKNLVVITPSPKTQAGKIFSDGQFRQMIIKKERANFTNGTFLSRSDFDVNREHIQDVLDKSVDYFGVLNKHRLNNLSAVLVEIINNTSSHADPDEVNAVYWLLNSLEVQEDGKRVKQYCLVDLGIGIYDSVAEKTEQWRKDNKKPLKWMREIPGKTQNRFLNSVIPTGIQSTTDLPERGRGVKYIHDEAQDDIYRKFEMITNRAHIDFRNMSNVKKDHESNLEGTIYYWEICVD
jgi:hypothetical protein